jgi:hypothetical protein
LRSARKTTVFVFFQQHDKNNTQTIEKQNQGRARSRTSSRGHLEYTEVLASLKAKGISIRCVLGLGGGVMRFSTRRHLGVKFLRCVRAHKQRASTNLDQNTTHTTTNSNNTTPKQKNPKSVASPKLVMEEAPEAYKDVDAVVATCDAAGISRRAVRLRPIGVVKG